MKKSDELWSKVKEVIPMGTQTLSKAPERFVEGVTPKFIGRGKGSKVWDLEGGLYIDYPCGLGAIILGHAYPEIIDAIVKSLALGNVFTLPSPMEGELAAKLVEIIPCAEMVRFSKNGGDATEGAIRIARAYTDREHIAFCGYHGAHDQMAITGGLKRGLPKVLGQFVHPFVYNDLDSLEHVLKKNECACVIMEQGLDEPKNKFLSKAVDMAHEHGAVFILDEIVTGFRYALGGVQEFYDVEPDIACIGKAMGNGMPLSAIVGKKEMMRTLEDGVFFSFTFAGEITSIAAAIAVIGVIQEKPVIDTLWSNGAMLFRGLENMKYDVGMWCHGNPVRFIIKFMDDEKEDLIAKSYFLQETVKRGILMGVPTFTTYSHTREDIMFTLEVCDYVLSKMQKIRGDYEKHLEGKPIQPPVIRA